MHFLKNNIPHSFSVYAFLDEHIIIMFQCQNLLESFVPL